MGAPLIVEQLAASVSGVPMKWREEEGYWVIIMTDGRKYRFPRNAVPMPRAQETTEDFKPGQEQPPNLHRKDPEGRRKPHTPKPVG